jgi:murein DD-endopeptidase MepM/ murein hydrolase activator NlpD
MVSVTRNQTTENRRGRIVTTSSNFPFSSRLNPGLEDYEKALKMLVEREQRQSQILHRESDRGIGYRRRPQKNVRQLMKDWEQEKQEQHSEFSQILGRSTSTEYRSTRQKSWWPNPQYAPVFFAALFIGISSFFVLNEPGTVISGTLNRVRPSLPFTSEAKQLVFEYATPLTDDKLSQISGLADTSKFQVLSTQEYVVQPGDTLSGIAHKYNLHMDTIISFNGITNPRAIRIGQKYEIPNRNGLLHKVQDNDTLETIAKKFDVSDYSILDANNMDSNALNKGQSLFIPDARMNPTDLKMLLGELFIWPVSGRFTSAYGYRADPFTGQRRFHNGIDLSNDIGTPIKAALAGRVVSVESQIGNYGKVVIIQHPRGFQTLYAHLSSFNVQVGQSVAAGQVIGRMGNTGRSTGSHLHFSVILNGAFVNPIRYLK